MNGWKIFRTRACFCTFINKKYLKVFTGMSCIFKALLWIDEVINKVILISFLWFVTTFLNRAAFMFNMQWILSVKMAVPRTSILDTSRKFSVVVSYGQQSLKMALLLWKKRRASLNSAINYLVAIWKADRLENLLVSQ